MNAEGKIKENFWTIFGFVKYMVIFCSPARKLFKGYQLAHTDMFFHHFDVFCFVVYTNHEIPLQLKLPNCIKHQEKVSQRPPNIIKCSTGTSLHIHIYLPAISKRVSFCRRNKLQETLVFEKEREQKTKSNINKIKAKS